MGDKHAIKLYKQARMAARRVNDTESDRHGEEERSAEETARSFETGRYGRWMNAIRGGATHDDIMRMFSELRRDEECVEMSRSKGNPNARTTYQVLIDIVNGTTARCATICQDALERQERRNKDGLEGLQETAADEG